ncbi:MAG: hypothetical protein E3J60_04550 [Dehalococcoidia bacterium]|nr:MAG: hypothetical protein E3J60_04550 [Dehalococcoidia bacterium]
MCLTEVTLTTRDRKQEGFGWKVFEVVNKKFKGEYYGGIRKEGVWLKSKDDGSEDYPLGFHLYQTRREARHWLSYCNRHRDGKYIVRKAKFRGILAEGRDNCRRVIVVKEMLILPQQTGG